MKKNIKMTVAIGVAVAAVIGIVAAVMSSVGGNLDVVGKESLTSFEGVLNAIPENVSEDKTNGAWSLKAPDGSVRFIWSQDYSTSPVYDVMLEFDAKPFLDAGLDKNKLPENYTALDQVLMVGTKLGNDKPDGQDQPSAIEAYGQIVNKYRSSINYHMVYDHYGVNLGGGNMFEWAKNLETNTVNKKAQDKDMVFVLNPEPLIAAGVDPEKVEGWTYAQVPMEMNGKNANVYKLLKPFDLK